MNIKTYNYIKQCFEMGHEVNVRHTKDGFTTTQILASINENYDEVKDNEVLNIEIIPRIPKLLQQGDKCYIIDTEETRKWAKDNGWGESKTYMIGNTFVIYNNDGVGSYFIKKTDRILDLFCFPYFMVAPVPPEENKLADVDTEDMVKELESRGLLKKHGMITEETLLYTPTNTN